MPVRIARIEYFLGGCLVRLDQFDEAERLLVGSLSTLKRAEAKSDVLQTLDRLVELYERWNKPELLTKYQDYRSAELAPTGP